ncbi:MAG: [acyl-carrier-protein] S-malonyltransferase [Clostridia bacterium]|nr:[acyl-carrier-protein] S-malonyltransferase [Clostridia bacterium]
MQGIVFVFPGQGSQYVGMGKDIAEHYPEAAEVFTEADKELGWSISEICFNGPNEQLVRTEYTQPAILTVSVACFRVLASKGIMPQAVAGHSLGEYSALVAAGSLEFRDAIKLVTKRAQLMEAAVASGRGGMVAVLGLSAEKVVELCEKVEKGVAEAVNFNAPAQVVVGGDRVGLDNLSKLAKEAGAKKVIPLQVSGPFHSSLMGPAARELAPVLREVTISDPNTHVVANFTGNYVRTADEVRESLIKQINNPVRWEDSVRRLLDDGYDTFIEVGPGKVLSGLIKRVNRRVRIGQVEDSQSLEKTLSLLREAKVE